MIDNKAVLPEIENEKLYVGDRWSFFNGRTSLIDCLAAEQRELVAMYHVCALEEFKLKLGKGLDIHMVG